MEKPNNHERKCKICGRPAKGLSEYCDLHFEERPQKELKDLFDFNLNNSCDIQENPFSDPFFPVAPQEEQKEPLVYDFRGELGNLTPAEFKEKLSQYVAGQEEAKRALALSSYWDINLMAKNTDYKGDVLLFIGPTGCGKTFSVDVLAEILPIQVEQYEAENMRFLHRIRHNSLEPERTKKPLKRFMADRSVVLIENIDKIVSDNLILVDLNAEKQKNLLNFIYQKRQTIQYKPLHTFPLFSKTEPSPRPALIVMTGQFAELAQIVRVRKGLSKYASFEELAGPYCHIDRLKRDYELIQEITADDLVRYGFLPELVGEITHIVCFEPLSREDLKTILLETQKSVLRQYQAMVAALDCELLFTEEAIDKIVERAYAEGLGAYRLNFHVKRTLEHILWRLPELRKQSSGTLRIQVTVDTVENPQEFLCN